MSLTERRYSPRRRARAREYASYAEGSGSIRDISLRGVFIEDPEPLPEGMEFDLRLHLRKETLAVRGVVRRSIPKVGMAIQFQHAPWIVREKLEKYLGTIGGAQLG